MYFSTSFLIATLAAIPTFAAPAPAAAKSMMVASAAEWTIESMVRTCYPDGTLCNYSYNINTYVGAATPCFYSVAGNPASQTNYNSIHCGAFTISSGWSGQFGPGAGFSTLAVTDGTNIIYPAYSDNQLGTSGQTVSPDQSYAPQALP